MIKKTVRDVLLLVALACGLHGLAAAATGARPSTGVVPGFATVDSCSWNRPGVNPFMGDVVSAVDRYRDIPPDVRERLKARMARREYDDLVSIRRDSIDGRGGYDYGNTISDMHFGTRQLCRTVTRAAWSPTMEERGLVYCESGHCILVPTVCRNVSRVTRKGVGNEAVAGMPPAGGEPLVAMTDLPPIDWFGPTGAGVPATGAGPTQGALSSTSAEGEGPIAGGSGGIPGYGGFPGFPGGGGIGGGVVLPPIVSTGPGAFPVPPVAAVPEPQTWALMLGGLTALLGLARRRRLSLRATASGSAR